MNEEDGDERDCRIAREVAAFQVQKQSWESRILGWQLVDHGSNGYGPVDGMEGNHVCC